MRTTIEDLFRQSHNLIQDFNVESEDIEEDRFTEETNHYTEVTGQYVFPTNIMIVEFTINKSILEQYSSDYEMSPIELIQYLISEDYDLGIPSPYIMKSLTNNDYDENVFDPDMFNVDFNIKTINDDIVITYTIHSGHC